MRFFHKTLWLIAAIGLAGCSDPAPFSTGAGSSSSPAPTHTMLGDVSITAPAGYCIDQSASRRNFRMLAACHILNDDPTLPYADPVLMTVTIAPQATDSALPTPDDIAASANLPLLQGRSQQDLVLAQLEGGNQRPFAAADTRHWRGVMALDGGYRAGLSLYAPAASPYAGVDGAEMLGRLRAGIAVNIQ